MSSRRYLAKSSAVVRPQMYQALRRPLRINETARPAGLEFARSAVCERRSVATNHHASAGFWAAAITATAAAVLASITLLWPDWIEPLTGINPDHGNGSFEWVLAVGLAVVSAALSLLAWRAWRGASPAPA